MNTIKKLLCAIVPTVMLGSVATPALTGEIVLSGSVACPAAYHFRKGGTEVHDRAFGLRNFNSDSTITITRVRAWNNDGTIAFDGIPGAGGFKSILGPHGSAKLNASNVLPPAIPPDTTMQVLIDYTLDKPGMPLHAGFVHYISRLDLGNYQMARQGGSCIHVPAGARHPMEKDG